MTERSLLVVVTFLFLFVKLSDSECPKPCACESNSLVCNTQKLSSVPTAPTVRIVNLYLNDNAIPKLDAKSFEGYHYVQNIYLGNNKIKSIDKSTFLSLYLVTIDLSNNPLNDDVMEAFENVTFSSLILPASIKCTCKNFALKKKLEEKGQFMHFRCNRPSKCSHFNCVNSLYMKLMNNVPISDGLISEFSLKKQDGKLIDVARSDILSNPGVHLPVKGVYYFEFKFKEATQLTNLRILCKYQPCKTTISSVYDIQPSLCSRTVHHSQDYRAMLSATCKTSFFRFHLQIANAPTMISLMLYTTPAPLKSSICTKGSFCSTKFEFKDNMITETKACVANCKPSCTYKSHTGTCIDCCTTDYCNQRHSALKHQRRLALLFKTFISPCDGSFTNKFSVNGSQWTQVLENSEAGGKISNVQLLVKNEKNCFVLGSLEWSVVKYLNRSYVEIIVARIASAFERIFFKFFKNTTLEIDNRCLEESNLTSVGLLVWPKSAQGRVPLPCPVGEGGCAIRLCAYDPKTGFAEWSEHVDLSQCDPLSEKESAVTKIDKAIVEGNFVMASESLNAFTHKYSKSFSSEELGKASNQLSIVLNSSTAVNLTLGVPLANVFSNLLEVQQKVISTASAQSFLASLERFQNILEETKTEDNTINTKMAAFSVLNISAAGSDRLALSATATSSRAGNASSVDLKRSNSFRISVPKSAAPSAALLRFAFIQTAKYFESADPKAKERTQRPVAEVLAASFDTGPTANLAEPVILNFLAPTDAKNLRCAFWKEKEREWSSDGCRMITETESADAVECHCDHLTNFALLMDVHNVGPVKHVSLVFSILSLIGTSISVVGLGLTLFSYLRFSQLRNMPGKILICLCFTLLFGQIVFLSGSWYQQNDWFCKIVAILLHYFYLSVMLWSTVEAVHLYLALVKVLGAHVSRFLLKGSLFAWGLPVLAVVITIAVSRDNYGLKSICFLAYYPFIGAFAAPIGVILIINVVIFVLVMRQMKNSSKACKCETQSRPIQRVSTAAQVRGSLGLCVLLGLTWVFAFFAVEPVTATIFQTLFIIFNTSQGLFIFLVYCVLKKDVLNAWSKKFPSLAKWSDYLYATSENSKTSKSGASTRRSTLESLRKDSNLARPPVVLIKVFNSKKF